MLITGDVSLGVEIDHRAHFVLVRQRLEPDDGYRDEKEIGGVNACGLHFAAENDVEYVWLRRLALSSRYGVPFDSAGFNLYRDGQDSVAWHGDRIRKEIEEPIVALLSLGEPRKFLLRPKGGGKSQALHLGRGDLLVTGGKTQRAWEHCVPKVARAGPRISIAYRYGLAIGTAASDEY